MISTLGTALILIALVFAAVGSVIGFWAGYKKNLPGWVWVQRCAYGFGAVTVGANLLMVYALLSHDFSVSYVAEVGSLSTPTYYTIISLWASLNGSILFWAGVLGLYVTGFTWTLRNKHREYMPYTLGVLLTVCIFFALLVASIANPFAPVSPVLLDGPGPNPLLQNHWLMAFHPPTLYLGYVGMAVPFSMACGALLAGRLEAGWMAPLRRWMLIPWIFLTGAIMLGGWWSYEVLGWGGYWAWDPVENASFLPWLTATAFLHSGMVMQRKGTLKTWSVVLVMATFLLTLLGTFMTRSGVFNSVHSFTQSDIGPVFLVFIAISLTGSIVLLAVKDWVLDEPKEQRKNSSLFSREVIILLQNLLFAVFTFTVLLGTLYPLIAEAIDGTRVSVGEPFFNRMAVPLSLAIVFLMGVGPAVPWGRLSEGALKKTFLPPIVAGLAVAGVVAALGYTKPYFLLAMGECTFAGWLIVNELIAPIKARMVTRDEGLSRALIMALTRNGRVLGANTSHLGVVLTTIAIATSGSYKQERDVTLQVGESAELAGYVTTYKGSATENEPHRDSLVATVEVTQGGAVVTTLKPRLNYYRMMREPVGTPSVHVTPAGDLYLSLMHVEESKNFASFRIFYSPFVVWIWIGVIVICGGALLALIPPSVWRRSSERRSRTGRVNLVMLLAGLMGTALLVVILGSGFGKNPSAVPSMLEGHRAPDFSLVDMDGKSHQLTDYRGQVVIINFWSTWCQPCKIEHPLLLDGPRALPDVQFLGIIYSDESDKARRYLKQNGATFPHLVDPDSTVAIDFGVAGVPETFFITPDGTISYKHVGPLDASTILASVERAGERG